MTDDEVDALLSGMEDSQGQINYEGKVDHQRGNLPNQDATEVF